MPSISRWIGLDNLRWWGKLMKHNHGIFGLLYNLNRMDVYKYGQLIGEDKYGNKYYQNDRYFFGKNRWVEYNQTTYLDYDGSQVPAEWHNWLHYICDDPPTINPRVQYKWMQDHTENLSGSQFTYVPYSTTKPKIASWQPTGTKLKITANK